jgi:transcriptional regulator with XRE-family HTH domain
VVREGIRTTRARRSEQRFADWLRSEQRRTAITQEELAAACGVSQQAVSRWIRGAARPGGIRLGKLAAVLGIPVGVVIERLEADDRTRTMLPTDPPVEFRSELADLRKRLVRLERLAEGFGVQKRQRPPAH